VESGNFLSVFSLERIVRFLRDPHQGCDPKGGYLKTWIHTKGKKNPIISVHPPSNHPPVLLPLYAMARKKYTSPKAMIARQRRLEHQKLKPRPRVPRMMCSVDTSRPVKSGADPESDSGADSENDSGAGSENDSGAGSENNSGSSTATESESATEWTFNKGLNLVLHDIDHCRMCREFAEHYCNAKICLHQSYYTACSTRNLAIAQDVQKQIDLRRLQLEQFNKTISYLQQKLKAVRQEMDKACINLKGRRRSLEKVRHKLEEARRVRAAASGTNTSESSQHPRPSRSPSPRPHKSSRHAPTPSTISNLASSSNLHPERRFGLPSSPSSPM
jgi:hypothetical protein